MEDELEDSKMYSNNMKKLFDAGQLAIDQSGLIGPIADEKVGEEIAEKLKEAKEEWPDLDYKEWATMASKSVRTGTQIPKKPKAPVIK